MAKTKETELRDDYDLLTSDEQRLFEEMGSNGWRPVKEDGSWTATNDDVRMGIGPYPTMTQLHAVVMDEVFAPAESKGRNMGQHPTREAKIIETALNADEDGNAFLPGIEETVQIVDIPELRQPALDFHAYETEFASARERLKGARTLLTELMEQYKDSLPIDTETGNRFFRVIDHDNPHDRTVQIDLIDKGEQIKSHIVGGEDV